MLCKRRDGSASGSVMPRLIDEIGALLTGSRPEQKNDSATDHPRIDSIVSAAVKTERLNASASPEECVQLIHSLLDEDIFLRAPQVVCKRLVKPIMGLLKQGRHEDVEQLLTRITDQTEAYVSLWVYLGQSYNQANRLQEALRCYAKNAGRGDVSAYHRLQYGLLLCEKGELENAGGVLQSLVPIDVNNVCSQLLRRIVQAMVGRDACLAAWKQELREYLVSVTHWEEGQAHRIAAPYSVRLRMRMEANDVCESDRVAAQVMLAFHEVTSQCAGAGHVAVREYCRWLVLTGQSESAEDVACHRAKKDATMIQELPAIALACWISEGGEAGRTCLQLWRSMQGYLSATPRVLFVAAVGAATLNDPEFSVQMLARLEAHRPDYFVDQRSDRLWGMLALLLKALGHSTEADRLWQLAAEKDSFHYAREHLFDRISTANTVSELPPFVLHVE